MDIAVDFDGTVVTHEYPKVGTEIQGAVEVLNLLVQNGHSIVINTMRGGKYLQDAIDWYAKRNIPLLGANYNPSQSSWTTSTKTYAQLYIDDSALGCPLKFDTRISNRPFVDWQVVKLMLMEYKLIK